MLYVMIGVPASGKSTTIKERYDKCVVISTDAIRKELYGDEATQGNGERVFNLAYLRIYDALAEGRDVVFDATNLRARDRKRAIDIAHELGDKATAVYCKATLELALKRNAERERHVPEEVIYRMFGALEEPKYEEGFAYIRQFTQR